MYFYNSVKLGKAPGLVVSLGIYKEGGKKYSES